VPEIIRYGKVIRPGLGVTIADERITERLGLNGVLIINVQRGSASEEAGLRGTARMGSDLVLGDIIETVNGSAVANFDELRNELEKYRVGDMVTLGIVRNERRIEVRVKLEQVD
jgi:S1-C subfamily serine protease